jgi:sucrose-6-phosphate hydrolase SacC (GH32 family)
MGNWQYANQDPTTPWRGMFTVPRALRLIPTAEGLRLGQEPVAELKALRGQHWSIPAREVAGSVTLAPVGDALEIVAELAAGSAASFGLKLRKGGSDETIVGYDVAAGELFVDRRRSGNVGFHRDFPGRHAAALVLDGGRLRLHAFVDRSSVEVFAGGGRTVITDRIFPDPASQGVEAWAEGGAAALVALEAWRLDMPARR